MSTARLAARVEGVRASGVGQLHHHELVFDKPGRDGTAKANVRPRAGAIVHGVVWEIERPAIDVLDRFEPGYVRSELEIVTSQTGSLVAWTYRYVRSSEDGTPSPEYLSHLIEGALEHGLPADLIGRLQRTGRRQKD